MAQLKINIKNNILDETLDHLISHFTNGGSYKATIPDVNSTIENPLPDVVNPLTKQDTVEKYLSDFIRAIYNIQDTRVKVKNFEQNVVNINPIG
jgi:hypothetical protein